MGKHRLEVVRGAVQGAPAVWLRPVPAFARRGQETTGGGCPLGEHARTTASCGRGYDRCRSERAVATRPLSAKPAAVAGGGNRRAALTRRSGRRQ